MYGMKLKKLVKLKEGKDMSKIYYHILVNYKDVKSGELHWWEKSWLDCTPEEMMQRFNETLQLGERARKIIDYEILEGQDKPHTWRKSNLVTISKGEECFDTYKCEECGVTGKRFTLDGGIALDKKYKKKEYCNEHF